MILHFRWGAISYDLGASGNILVWGTAAGQYLYAPGRILSLEQIGYVIRVRTSAGVYDLNGTHPPQSWAFRSVPSGGLETLGMPEGMPPRVVPVESDTGITLDLSDVG